MASQGDPYQYLSVTSHVNCIAARCLIKHGPSHGMCLYQGMMTLNFLMTLLMTLNQHINKRYVIIASLKSGIMGKLISRIPG